MRAALYLRVSTLNGQTTDNQRRELEAAAARLGHEIVAVYEDNGISGAKGRDQRPAFDRLGRSMQDLGELLSHLHAARVGLYLHQQGIDTTTPGGKAMFQMFGVFAEFERAMIRERVLSGMARARAKGTRTGRPFGRPNALDPITCRKVREAYAKGGIGLRPLAKRFGVSVMTVRKCLAMTT